MTKRVPIVLKRRVPASVTRAMRYSASTSDADVSIYRVWNSADRAIWLLTSTSEGAIEIAFWDNLIRDRRNARVEKWISDEPPWVLSKCWSAVQRAVRERRQGKIEPNGNFIVMCGEVISPMSSVK